ncbi:MAG TPA: 50S ribosomal protein L11 methyltransferase [Streptosporangiaceae bacterium]|nr:50S ribosomal protein L11 methyltransferase [Streptosporangiaceae bacterium]
MAAASLADFIRSRTAVAAPPLIPEIRLHLSGEEPTALWERTERETGRSDLPPPFWAYPWAGGIALARYLLDHPERAAGRVVLDLASGSGLVAVAAARAGAARVIASDIDPMAVAAIALNAAVNDVDILVTDADLLTGDLAGGAGGAGGVADGGAGGALLAGQANLPAPDLVVVGDACYERRLAHRMLAFLRRAQSSGASALLGDPGRAYLPATGLEPVARYVVPAWPGLEDTEVKESRVWQLASGG